jgi:hypothetical protein
VSESPKRDKVGLAQQNISFGVVALIGRKVKRNHSTCVCQSVSPVDVVQASLFSSQSALTQILQRGQISGDQRFLFGSRPFL